MVKPYSYHGAHMCWYRCAASRPSKPVWLHKQIQNILWVDATRFICTQASFKGSTRRPLKGVHRPPINGILHLYDPPKTFKNP